MPPRTSIKNTDVVILCGGRGKRLRRVVNDRPKVMAKLDSRPFLDLLLGHLSGLGFSRFILCTGYKGGFIKDYYRTGKKSGLKVVLSQEKSPLGTGGALKKAKRFIHSEPFLVANGDSFIRADIQGLMRLHAKKHALISVILKKSSCAKDYGSVRTDKTGKITAFQEKNRTKESGLINCGVYLCSRKIFGLMPGLKNFSLEYDFFPNLKKENFYGYVVNGTFIDIGTPENYKKAEKIFSHGRQKKRMF